MQLEMLISAVNAVPEELLNKMKPECNGILMNQCSVDKDETVDYKDCRFKVLCRNQRGVGKSRNLALDHASAEILLFCDEDIEYDEGYAAKILDEFGKHPEADLIVFNLRVCPERRTYWNEGFQKIHWYNRGRYGACSVALRKDKLEKAGVRFSELFGGGAKYSNGEDSLFLKECADAGIQMYTSEAVIGEEVPRESTWFAGYNEKFFFDRGVLFAFLYGAFAWIWTLRFVITKKQMMQGEIKRKQAYRLMCQGIRQGKQEKKAQK